MENNNIPPNYYNVNDYRSTYYADNNVSSSRYNDNYNRRFNRRFDRRYDRRYDRDFYDDPWRYYQYPYCDRYGRCENPIWWMFWPLFFL